MLTNLEVLNHDIQLRYEFFVDNYTFDEITNTYHTADYMLITARTGTTYKNYKVTGTVKTGFEATEQ